MTETSIVASTSSIYRYPLVYSNTTSTGVVRVTTLDVDPASFIETNNLTLTFEWTDRRRIMYCVACFDGDIHPHLLKGPVFVDSKEDLSRLIMANEICNEVEERTVEGKFNMNVLLPRYRGCYYFVYHMGDRGTPFNVVVEHTLKLGLVDNAVDELTTYVYLLCYVCKLIFRLLGRSIKYNLKIYIRCRAC
jgi:hypothetical protein